jgi:trehalose 6-phosphate synthase/phosphatase
MEKRLFIVSNRLPVTVHEEKGVQHASGGLITAIQGYMRNITHPRFSKVYWAGVPGCSIGTWEEAMKSHLATTFSYLPVFVNQSIYNGYYNGHANSLLWPLFHYFPSYAEYNEDNCIQYQQVNEQFAHTLMKHLRPGDTVWIHDYHLLPLPALLRKELSELTIGFFLHIPFPSYEVFRLLPRRWREDLLNGVLGADLVGFHTIDYATHFLQSVQMILGLDHDRHIIRNKDRLIKVDVFPVSIDYNHFNQSYNDEQVTLFRQSLLHKAGIQKIIFSVDRLDYTKGVYNRLIAYEYFLLQNPDYRQKVVFVLVVVPSRDGISKYAERKQMIDQTISSINSRIGNIHWQPVIYQYNSLPFKEMIAFYTGCHVALITPLRDGMNLIAKEFVASRKDKRGVLIISEMAGAARELTDAITINPNDITEMADAIKTGLEMPEDEQAVRLETMQSRIADYDVKTWAEDFLNEVENMKNKQLDFQVKFLDNYSKGSLLDNYRSAQKRLLLLDYDGTLIPFTSNPSEALPGKALIQLLTNLKAEKNTLCLISGRSSAWLDKCFGDLDLNMIAEHGARFKYPNQGWTNEVMTQNDWKERIRHIMRAYVRRCAHSFVEEKEFSMVWHYRSSSPDQGKLRAAELLMELNDYVHNRRLHVSMGSKIIEVKNNGIDKGSAIKKFLGSGDYDFVLAIGDDNTDEDMFKVLATKKNSYTIKVGNEASFARYNLHTPQMVISLLETISHVTAGDVIP